MFGISFLLSIYLQSILGLGTKKYYSLAISMLGTVRLASQVTSVAIVTMIMSLGWSFLTSSNELLRHIEISFIVFAILCVIGIVLSAACKEQQKAK